MNDQQHSTSRGFGGNQVNLDESLETAEASGEVSGNNTATDPPERGYKMFTQVNKWFESFEDDLLHFSSDLKAKLTMKDTVVEWLGERCRISEVKPEAAIIVTTRDDRPKPVYWWQRERGVRSPAPASSSSGISSGQSDSSSATVAELTENGTDKCLQKYPTHLDIPATPSLNLGARKEQGYGNDSLSDSGHSMSESPRLFMLQATSLKKNSSTPSIESPVIELPKSLSMKCKPRPLGRSELRASEESSPEEEEVPVIFFFRYKPLARSIEPRRSRSAERQSRSLERKRSCVSAERAGPSRSTGRLTKSIEVLSSSSAHSERPRRGFRSRLRRWFASEDNLLHRVAWRGRVIYCSCLCLWYRFVKEYKKVNSGMRRMNRENR